ncbi:hypothetical protein PSHT_14455 [Puccinia striiformis]|uniref:Uncharacterized protein n=1 Tax=Puccinia striiformis TaxID=27350 RepID=A0A2S4UKD4_9BASI|nr:hypothetical protein PSHT_14455 [Puccinia striiformis]
MQGIENRSVQDIRIQIEKLKISYRHAYCWRYRMIQERENGRYASIDWWNRWITVMTRSDTLRNSIFPCVIPS